MSGGTNSSVSKIAMLAVAVPLLALGWFMAPWIMPVWRWQNLDFAAIAKAHEKEKLTEAMLRQEYDMVVWYKARKAGDPMPYVIVSCNPPIHTIWPDYPNEVTPPLLVRATVVSERDGEGISKMWVGATPEERFFKIRGWRLPPGSLGKNPKRTVVVYQGFSLEKVDISIGVQKRSDVERWEVDDNPREWPDRDDGFGQ